MSKNKNIPPSQPLHNFHFLKSELIKNGKKLSTFMAEATKHPLAYPEKIGNRTWAKARKEGVSEVYKNICIKKIEGVFSSWGVDSSEAIKTIEIKK